MAKKLGTSAVLTVGTDGVTYNALENVTSVDWSVASDTVEITDNDSTYAFKEFLIGNRTASCSFTMRYNISSVRQKTMMEEIAETDGGDLVYWRYYPGGNASGERLVSFQGFVTDVKQGAQNASAVDISVTVTPSGAITVATV